MKTSTTTTVRATVPLNAAEQFLAKEGSVLVTQVDAFFEVFADGTTGSFFWCSGLTRLSSGAFGRRVSNFPGIRKNEIPSAIIDRAVAESRKAIGNLLGRIDLESATVEIRDWSEILKEARN